MDYFLSGGQAVAGFATLVLLWLTLNFIGREADTSPLVQWVSRSGLASSCFGWSADAS